MFEASADSWWRLTLDLGSAKLLVWVASVGRPADLTRDAHLLFADRYQRLGQVHRAHHRIARAERLEQKAQEHLETAGWRGPPYAAAMAMPHPPRFTLTNAVSHRRVDGSDDAA
jgi:hypothetical protein